LWYSDFTLNAFVLISKMRKGNKERKQATDTDWENKERKK